MKLNYKIVAGVVAAVSLGAAGLSLAHPGGMGYGMGPGMGPGTGMGMGPGVGYGTGPGMVGPMAGAEAGTFVAGRLAGLKVELKIAPAQESAWAAFENQAQQQVTSMQAMRKQMLAQAQGSQQGASNADIAALREAMFKLHQANDAARSAVLKDLYAVLTPEQKAVADQRLAGGYGRGMAHRHGFD